MKNILSLLLLVCLSVQCRSDDEANEPPYRHDLYEAGEQADGFAEGTLVTIGDWAASAHAKWLGEDSLCLSIYFQTYTDRGFRARQIILSAIPVADTGNVVMSHYFYTGQGDPCRPVSWLSVWYDGDIPVSSVAIDTTRESTLNFSYDAERQSVAGTFDLYYVQEHSGITFQLEDGRFEAAIIE